MHDYSTLATMELALFFGGPVLVMVWVTWSERRRKAARTRATSELDDHR